MKVYQTRFGTDGNCVAACWATLTGVPLDAIPDLSRWPDETAFAQANGFGLLRVCHMEPKSFDQALHGCITADGTLYMLSGVSPRGYGHRVIGCDGALWHDPHPEGGGVDRILGVIALARSVKARAA
jgi:hypothetical protein